MSPIPVELEKVVQMHSIDGRPIEPTSTDCCQNGCLRCVWTVYEENMQAWVKSGGTDIDYVEVDPSIKAFREFERIRIKYTT